MPNLITRPFLHWAENLRFPKLALITLSLFVADVIIPDVIPFVDEILLALATLLLGNLRRRGTQPQEK